MCDDFERFVVIIPTSFTMNEAEYEEYVRRIEAVSLRVVIQLNKYMKLVGTSDYLATDMEADEQMAGYISDSVSRLKYADYAVFAEDWQSSAECRLLHEVAELFQVKILEL